MHSPRAMEAFDDPYLRALETRLGISTAGEEAEIEEEVEHHAWCAGRCGPVSRRFEIEEARPGRGAMAWTRLGSVLLKAGPQLSEGEAEFSLFVTRGAVMLSWTGGEDDPRAWQGEGSAPDPFVARPGPAWRLGVAAIEPVASNHARLAAMAGILEDLAFHHAVMERIVGVPFPLGRTEFLTPGPRFRSPPARRGRGSTSKPKDVLSAGWRDAARGGS